MITNLPKKLRDLRKIKRMNNKEFCEFLDIPYDTVKSWLCGRNNPNESNAKMLEKFFNEQ